MRDMSILLIGAGGFAREVYSWASHDPHLNVFAFFDEHPSVPEIYGVPVVKSLKGFEGRKFLVAVGDPVARAKLWDAAIAAGLNPADALIHRSATTGIEVYAKPGCIICPGAILTTNIVLERGVIVNIGATVGHDCRLGEFTTVSPGANISGCCTIGPHCYIGTNASLREKLSIGRAATVGMGAVAVKNIPDGEVWVGNPAKPLVQSGLVTH